MIAHFVYVPNNDRGKHLTPVPSDRPAMPELLQQIARERIIRIAEPDMF
ncbi:MAG TPA: hypothetical protein VJN43_01440 [Bryobacteraceae bacterium]|nr:hypothetical protein [Bryobacteraceae bacterium]